MIFIKVPEFIPSLTQHMLNYPEEFKFVDVEADWAVKSRAILSTCKYLTRSCICCGNSSLLRLRVLQLTTANLVLVQQEHGLYEITLQSQKSFLSVNEIIKGECRSEYCVLVDR